MSEQDRSLFAASRDNVAQVHDLLGRLFRVAEPGAVYSEPIVAGDRTVIVTSEISMSIGAGFGQSSSPPTEDAAPTGATPIPTGAPAPRRGDTGGGGGGFSFGRPVAAVIIEPAGVRVEPIVDPTKLGIAFFTTLGAMFFAWTSLRRTTKELATRELAAKQLAADTRAASRAGDRSARQAAKEAANEAKLAAQLAAKEAGQQARHAAKLAAKEARKAAKEVAKDAARLAAKQTAKQLA